MLRLTRKTALLIATVGFVSMVTEVSLHVHFLNHEHPEEHDSEHCSICQQLLVTPGKFIAEPESFALEFIPQKNNIEFHSQSFVITFQFNSFSPRPPPQLLMN